MLNQLNSEDKVEKRIVDKVNKDASAHNINEKTIQKHQKTNLLDVKWNEIVPKAPKQEGPYIGNIDEAPLWMYQKQRYIYTGHRINFNQNKFLTRSLFMLHNQSFNVWSHIITGIYLLYALYSIYLFKEFRKFDFSESEKYYNDGNYQRLPIWPFYVEIGSAAFCCFASSFYHLYQDKDERQYIKTRRIDYCGITAVACGGMTSTYYYGFYCQPFFLKFYLGFGYTMCLVITTVSLFEKFHSLEFLKIKVAVYFGLSIAQTVPIIHLMIQAFEASPDNLYLSLDQSSKFYCYAFFSAIVPQIIYVARIPERFIHGTFDIIGQSHNIWHIGASLIMINVFLGSIIDFNERLSKLC